MKKKRKHIHKPHKNGLFNPDAPFWRGDRAEGIIKARLARYKAKRTRRKSK